MQNRSCRELQSPSNQTGNAPTFPTTCNLGDASSIKCNFNFNRPILPYLTPSLSVSKWIAMQSTPVNRAVTEQTVPSAGISNAYISGWPRMWIEIAYRFTGSRLFPAASSLSPLGMRFKIVTNSKQNPPEQPVLLCWPARCSMPYAGVTFQKD